MLSTKYYINLAQLHLTLKHEQTIWLRLFAANQIIE